MGSVLFRYRRGWSTFLGCGMLLAAFLCCETASAEPPLGPVAQAPVAPQLPRPKKTNIPHPFPSRAPAHLLPQFPRDAEWLNTGGPIRLKDLRGKFVVLDFWTYCCINCIHILPELKKLEHKYPDKLVVIGVHSAKFAGEKDIKNISEAILRYEIEHPVVNDADHKIWNSYGIQSWPSIVLIDPEGAFVGRNPGEFKAEMIGGILDKAIPYYKARGTLDTSPVHFERLKHAKETPLRFPGKVLADEAGGRLFITDSNHNRIVISKLDGTLVETIGSGAIGSKDGGYATCEFDHPQGVALNGDTLYVADTENHLLRKVDLATKEVTTIAGIGEQGASPWPGGRFARRFVGPPLKTGINSPWALWVHEKALYIAMAGPHQIWKMPLTEKEIGPFAGNAREDIVDGPLMPREPYALGASSFAQPSGLTSDGDWLYVADSEGSSIRAVPFDPKMRVKTVVGSAHLRQGRLFAFGDVDGHPKKAKLQHALGVAYHDGVIYIADTYNNKIKVVNAKDGTTKTLAGSGKSGLDDKIPTFDEPAGIAYAAGKLYVADTNNHEIRVVDLKNGNAVSTLQISGLKPPVLKTKSPKPDFSSAQQVKIKTQSVKPVGGKVTLNVSLQLPIGFKINTLAPMKYYVSGDGNAIAQDAFDKWTQVEDPKADFTIDLPAASAGTGTVQVGMHYYYCQASGEGICKVGSVHWTVPVTVSATATTSDIKLSLEVN